MLDILEKRLTKHGYTKDDNEYYHDYRKILTLERLTIVSVITIHYEDDPDGLHYTGLVTMRSADGIKMVGEWDASRRYRLMDTIVDCERIIGFGKALHDHLTNKAD
jgi:hypothetical protein